MCGCGKFTRPSACVHGRVLGWDDGGKWRRHRCGRSLFRLMYVFRAHMHVGCAAGAAHGCSPSCQTVRQSVPNRRAVRAAVAAATDTHTLPPPARRYLTPCEHRTKGESIWHGPLGSAGRICVLSAVRTAHRRRDGLTHSLALSPPPCLSPTPPCCARTAAVSGEERSPSPSAARKMSARTYGRWLLAGGAATRAGEGAQRPISGRAARAPHRVACCLDVWRPAAGCGNEPAACVCQKIAGG